jgi:hypothetical protein
LCLSLRWGRRGVPLPPILPVAALQRAEIAGPVSIFFTAKHKFVHLFCKKGWTKLAMSTVIGFRMKFHGSFGGNLAAGLQKCKFTFLAETRLII